MFSSPSAKPRPVNGSDVMSNGDVVEAIAPSHVPTMKLFGNCCRNAPRPRRPSMALVCHANCQTSRTGVSRWFYKFSSEGLAMWPAGHTFKPRLGCFRSRGCVSIKNSIGERLWPERDSSSGLCRWEPSSTSPTSDLNRPEIGSRTCRALSFRNGDAMDCSRFMPSAGRRLDRQRRQRFASESG